MGLETTGSALRRLKGMGLETTGTGCLAGWLAGWLTGWLGVRCIFEHSGTVGADGRGKEEDRERGRQEANHAWAHFNTMVNHNACIVPFVFFTAGIDMSLRVFLFMNVTIFRS
jgi:hypothetical protein